MTLGDFNFGDFKFGEGERNISVSLELGVVGGSNLGLYSGESGKVKVDLSDVASLLGLISPSIFCCPLLTIGRR